MDQQIKPLFIVARVLLAQLFFISGVGKALAYGGTLGYFKMVGIPLPDVTLPLTILIEVGGGLAVAFGWKLRPVAIVMALFTLGTALMAHQFWAADAAHFAAQWNNFLKNVAIAGAFVLLLATESAAQPAALSFAGRRQSGFPGAQRP